MKSIVTIAAGLAATIALAGCSASSSSEEDPSASGDEVVGITDITTLERAFGLVAATQQSPGSTTALQAGACYRALASSGYPEFEFRRYANGAAFFSKKGSGVNSGDYRPILCLDTHAGNTVSGSYGGVVLDAILRYDLGKLTSSDGKHLAFERGAIDLEPMADADRLAAAAKRPHEVSLEQAPSIGGSLKKITLKGVMTDVMFDGRHPMDLTVDGPTAFFFYRYAWRKAEDTGRFRIAEDALGPFKKTGELFGDGPASGQTLHFARLDGFAGMYAEETGDTYGTQEVLQLRAPNAPQDRAPSAECMRRYGENQAPGAFSCTGI